MLSQDVNKIPLSIKSFEDALSYSLENGASDQAFGSLIEPTLPKSESKTNKTSELHGYRSYVSSLLDEDLLHPGDYYKHSIINQINGSEPELIDYLKLDVLFWDLPTVCSKENIALQPLCPECGSKLTAIPLGPRKRFMLRKLYGIHEAMLLVTSMFRCAGVQKHEILGYDPRILKFLPMIEMSFLLFHRAGTTRELVDFILSKTTDGLKIHQIQEVLAQNYLQSYNDRKQAYMHRCTLYLKQHTREEAFLDFPIYKPCSPSVTLVTQCCLTAFKEKEEFYRSTMAHVEAHEIICFDDSFQVASNLQTSKTLTNPVVQFKRVAYVTNETGQIMTWQLTRDDSFKEVMSTFDVVRNRHLNSAKILRACLTNRCCDWLHDLKNLLGHNVAVKYNLNLFLEQIAQSIMLDNKQRAHCFQSFENVFRQDIDKGSKRSMATPETSKIQENMSKFLLEWKDQKCENGSSLIPPSVLREICSLEPHISNGCLSNLPSLSPDVYSFLDIHHVLKRLLTNARIGIPLAMSLFSIGFHELNAERGVAVQEVKTCALVDGKSLVDENAPLGVIIERIDEFIENRRKTTELAELETINSIMQNENGNLKAVLMYMKCLQSIAHFVPDVLITPRLMPYFLSPLHLIVSPAVGTNDERCTEYFKDAEELKNCFSESVTDECNVSIISAVVGFLHNFYALNKNSEILKMYFNFLLQLALDFTESIESVIQQVIVQISIVGQLSSSLQTLYSLADLFGAVIFLLTNSKRFAILPIYPKTWNSQSPNIFLLYRGECFIPILLDLSSVNGMPSTSPSEVPLDSQFKNFRCRCGRGKAEGNQLPKCVTLEGQRYPSRCLCFRAGEACTSICDCRACDNPHGKASRSTLNPVTGKRSRKRHKHDAQNLFKEILSRVPSKSTSDGRTWNNIEYLLLEVSLNLFVASTEQFSVMPWSGLATKLLHDQHIELVKALRMVPGLEKCVEMKSLVDLEQKLLDRENDVLTCIEALEANTKTK